VAKQVITRIGLGTISAMTGEAIVQNLAKKLHTAKLLDLTLTSNISEVAK